MPPHPAESPAKKQSKWSPEEDALIIDLRGGGMKWEDISKRLPGRSAISCRLHYQNYLERRSEWDEERKNKLARLYERYPEAYQNSTSLVPPIFHKKLIPHRFKPEMWSKVAEEMAVPWRAAEAMHWQLGEADMARRAGVVPFSLSSVSTDAPPPGHRSSPSRGHSHSQSQSSIMSGPPGPGVGPGRYSRPPTALSNSSSKTSGGGSARTIAARRESTPRTVPPASPIDGLALASFGGGSMGMGVSPYSTPAYATSMPMGGGYPSPGPMLPSIGMMGGNRPDGKRRGSPDMGPRETTRRRQ
ncbi:related to DRPLA protein [Rhynchosporium graminicola]|uniref:Related to DRPLA protein n=1 Tax=Rhynchosporium graminicola TaxID=2792576 RepID=A0A1E1KPN9_9HELO|nr:related to DRPLA protein [Rhynchosporium commune]